MGTHLGPDKKGGQNPHTHTFRPMFCGQTAGWNKMLLGTEVGLGPGQIVFDEDPAPLPQKGAQPPIFAPCLLWSNSWIDQDTTWYEDRHWPRRHCVTWGSSSPQKGHSPQFSSHVCCGQMTELITMPLGMEIGIGVSPPPPLF